MNTDNVTKFDWRALKDNSAGFMRLLFKEFSHHEGPQNAAALTYTTLLSLVPLMAVSLAIFSAFPVADKVNEGIQDFLFQNFVPASGEVVQEYLETFSAKASRLSGIGSAFLVLVALMLMGNIDRALNAIWEVRSKRSVLNKFLIYWAVLSLGPLLIGASVLVTSYLISLPILSDAASSGIGRRLLGLTPVVASTLAFSLTYAIIPNTRVSLRHAFIGGLVAALLFEGAKRGFAMYITAFPTYEAIYGAMAAVPIFLIWIYMSWILVLIGAEVTHCLALFRWGRASQHHNPMGMLDAVRILLLLDDAAAAGKSRTCHALVDLHPDWTEPRLEGLLWQMLEMKLVHQTREGDWALARRLDDLSLRELYLKKPFHLPQADHGDWPTEPSLAAALEQANAGVAQALDVPMSEFRLHAAEALPMQRVSPAE